MKRCYLTLALLASLLTASSAAAQDCTTEWTNAAGGAYNDATNWSDGLPDAEDDACITLAGTYAVTNTSGAGINVNTLQLGGETGTQTLETSRGMALGASGTIGANAVLAWTAGYLESGTLTNEGLVQLTANVSSRGVRGASALFRNEGTVTWEDDGSFYVYNDGRAENASIWEVQGGGDFFSWGNVRGDFVNETGATLRKTTATAETRIARGTLFFENAGTIDVQSGTMTVQRPSAHTNAAFAVTEDATLQFTGNSVVTFAGTTTGSPTGQLILASPFEAGEDDGAAWNVGGTGIEWTANYLESGTLTNAGLVRLTTTSNRGVRGVGALFRNEGTVEWTDDGRFYVYEDGRAENAALWNVQGGGDLLGSGSVRATSSTRPARRCARPAATKRLSLEARSFSRMPAPSTCRAAR